jgi:phosphonate transport system substrate-binding protein
MNEITLGAVAYDPKVVTIWEGMRSYFRDEAKLPVEIVLYLSYEAQVQALLRKTIDIAWNTNLAFLQAEKWSEGRCKALAMRDTDMEWNSLLIAPKGGAIRTLNDVRGKRVALGSRDSGHAAILPTHFLAQNGLVENKDYHSVRFNTDLGKHGDTGTSEVDVLKAVMNGSVDAGMVGSPFWHGLKDAKLVPEGAVEAVWTSPAYHHCMFTAREGLAEDTATQFVAALLAMSFENPKHRPVLIAEGLKVWLKPSLSGYTSLREACIAQGFFESR